LASFKINYSQMQAAIKAKITAGQEVEREKKALANLAPQ
jgi:hypothetical protein